MEKFNKSLFVDTWGWLTFFDKKEQYHKRVKQIIENFKEYDFGLITTDYVLDETNTILFRRLRYDLALKAFDGIMDLIEQGYIKFYWIDEMIFEKARDLRKKFKDKPEISFTDLTSFATMQLLNIKNVLTDDRHFAVIGMWFKILPSNY